MLNKNGRKGNIIKIQKFKLLLGVAVISMIAINMVGCSKELSGEKQPIAKPKTEVATTKSKSTASVKEDGLTHGKGKTDEVVTVAPTVTPTPEQQNIPGVEHSNSVQKQTPSSSSTKAKTKTTETVKPVTPVQHTHNWVAVCTTVHHPDEIVTDSVLVGYRDLWTCMGCDIEGILPDFYSEAELVEHQRISREKNPDDFCHGYAFRSEPIYEKVPFVLNKGYDTQKLDYYKCSTCGEVKSN